MTDGTGLSSTSSTYRRKQRATILHAAHGEISTSAGSPVFFVPSTDGYGLSMAPRPSRRASGAPAAPWIAQFPANIATNPFVAPVPVARAIRRMRQTPHLSDEHIRLFFVGLQLDLEAGVGITTGQGEDPQVMLQWSDNGGHTWSNEHWVSAGRIGAYTRRAIWRRLGYGRDRVFRVTVSDPCRWRLLDTYLKVDPGTS
jgi:hypothetical protein